MNPIHVSHGCYRPRPWPAAESKDPALARTLRVNVLTLEVCAGLALINNALRELRALGIRAAAIEALPKDGDGARIYLSALSPNQANQLQLIADGSTRNTELRLDSATAFGVRLLWKIPQ